MKQCSRSPAPAIARRTLLQAATLAAGAGLALPAAEGSAAEPPTPTSDAPVWSGEYWAKKNTEKGEVNLNLWRKRMGAPKAGEAPLPVLFLVHGSSNSARTSFDLAVPAKGEYSLMNVLARYGYDVFALHSIGRQDVPYWAAALAGFTSYSVGHNVGASVLTGGAVRYRIYSAWGLNAIDVAKICFLAGLTFWLGNAAVLGLGISYHPEAASAIDQLLTHPDDAESMGAAGRRAVQTTYNWAIEEKKLLGLYRRLLQRTPR